MLLPMSAMAMMRQFAGRFLLLMHLVLLHPGVVYRWNRYKMTES
jgi:hypothetical protein